MNKSAKIKKILIVTAIILLVPLFGNIFIEGWNWGVFDFVFAASYIIFAGLVYSFGISKIRNKNKRLIVGSLFAVFLVAIWAMLATG